MIAACDKASSANARAAQNPGEAGALKDLITAEASLAGSLGRLFAQAEASPDLKAGQTMAGLFKELTSIENQVSLARQAYNDAVMVYEANRATFPTKLMAKPFNFGSAGLFLMEKPQETEAPKMPFS